MGCANDEFFCVGTRVILGGASLLISISAAVLFGFAPFLLILLVVLWAPTLIIGVVVTPKTERKALAFYMLTLLFYTVLVIGGYFTKYNSDNVHAHEKYESSQAGIIAMEESQALSGNAFCFASDDNFVVMQENESGGYERTEYPCEDTKILGTDQEPFVKTIEIYVERIVTIDTECSRALRGRVN